MKKLFFLFGLLLLIPFSSKSQEECLEPKFEDNCSSLLSSIFDDCLYLSCRPFSSKNDVNVMFTVTLKRNVLYIFNACGGGNNSMVINLYDSKDKLISSSLDPKTKKNNKIIVFRPETAGKYYVSSNFEKKDLSCCLIMFGMIKTNIEQYVNVKPKVN